MKILRRILSGVCVLVFIIGSCFALYPILEGNRLEQFHKQQTADFLMLTENPPVTVIPYDDHQMDAPTVYPELFQDIQSYNENLYLSGQAAFSSQAAYEAPSFLLSDYGIEDETFGIISVPQLELELPIYLGANEVNLTKGAAHLSGTSLPIGGENSNCVIAGHRGWRTARFFKDIPALPIGASVQIQNLWKTLEYTVIEKKVIYSSDIDKLLIRPEKDLLTLMTCEYGRNGVKLRYLVICERTAET